MREPITVESYVLRDGVPISVDSLTEKDRETLAHEIKLTYLTELFRGQAEVKEQNP